MRDGKELDHTFLDKGNMGIKRNAMIVCVSVHTRMNQCVMEGLEITLFRR